MIGIFSLLNKWKLATVMSAEVGKDMASSYAIKKYACIISDLFPQLDFIQRQYIYIYIYIYTW